MTVRSRRFLAEFGFMGSGLPREFTSNDGGPELLHERLGQIHAGMDPITSSVIAVVRTGPQLRYHESSVCIRSLSG